MEALLKQATQNNNKQLILTYYCFFSYLPEYWNLSHYKHLPSNCEGPITTPSNDIQITRLSIVSKEIVTHLRCSWTDWFFYNHTFNGLILHEIFSFHIADPNSLININYKSVFVCSMDFNIFSFQKVWKEICSILIIQPFTLKQKHKLCRYISSKIHKKSFFVLFFCQLRSEPFIWIPIKQHTDDKTCDKQTIYIHI